MAQSETRDLSDLIRDFKNHTSKKFLEVVNDNIESLSDWMKLVFEYHGKYKNKQIMYGRMRIMLNIFTVRNLLSKK